MRSSTPIGLLLASAALCIACGSGDAAGGTVTGNDGGATAPGTDGEAGATTSGGPTSTSGCAWNLPRCGGECVDLGEDNRHCGACGNACAAGSACVEGTCTPGACDSGTRVTCGSSCVYLPRHPENCGSCGTTCGAGQLCIESACTTVTGSGESCADPMILRQSKQDEAFTFGGATADEAPLTCGDPQKRADKVFRWTATDSKEFHVTIAGGTPQDDLVIEIFEGACGAAGVKRACNNDRNAKTRKPEARVDDAQAGKTYFIVVSSFGPPPLGRFYLHVDD